jgi:hypothetical protein
MARRKARKKTTKQKGKKKPSKKVSSAKKRAAKKRTGRVGLQVEAAAVRAVTMTKAEEVTGSCVYYDQDGRRSCEDGVTKTYCDKIKGSTFSPHGRC